MDSTTQITMKKWNREINKLDQSWVSLFTNKLHRREIRKIIRLLNTCSGYMPIFPNFLNPFKHFPAKSTKIVIIDSEPYNIQNNSDGYAYSSNHPVRTDKMTKIVETLISNDVGFIDHGINTLETWADKGILLLNLSFTIGNGNKTHFKYWKRLSYDIINMISYNNHRVIFMLWGKDAINSKKYITQKSSNIILEAEYPLKSYYTDDDDSWSCDHFAQVTNRYIPNFDWNL